MFWMMHAAPMPFQLIQAMDNAVHLGPMMTRKPVVNELNRVLDAHGCDSLPEPVDDTWIRIGEPGQEGGDAHFMNSVSTQLGIALHAALRFVYTDAPASVKLSATNTLIAFRRMLVVQFMMLLMLFSLCRCVDT